MTVNNPEELSNYISGHYRNLEGIYNLYEYNKNAIEDGFSKDIRESKKTSFLLEYFGFLTSFTLDLLTVYKGLKVCQLEWEKIYFSKSIYLIIYEAITWHTKNGKEIHVISKDYPELKNYHGKILRYKKDFKKDFGHTGKMKDVRHFTAGHFD